jgi:hypothetical protein
MQIGAQQQKIVRTVNYPIQTRRFVLCSSSSPHPRTTTYPVWVHVALFGLADFIIYLVFYLIIFILLFYWFRVFEIFMSYFIRFRVLGYKYMLITSKKISLC